MTQTAAKRAVVLVVEDDVLLRINAAEMIESAGFDVIETASADEAIAVLERCVVIHVVFTDIQMPGSMDGLKLAHVVRSRWPPVGIIATSGQVAPRPGDLPEGGKFLQKPYSAVLVANALRELIGDSIS
jgi:CheY-like chemotaxis protein